jgi:hypothetical protein
MSCPGILVEGRGRAVGIDFCLRVASLLHVLEVKSIFSSLVADTARGRGDGLLIDAPSDVGSLLQVFEAKSGSSFLSFDVVDANRG